MVEVLVGRRVVALPAALDAASWPEGAKVLRFAPDDALVVGDGQIEIDDPHAIIEADSGFCFLRISEAAIVAVLARSASWQLPDARPCLAQGMIAGLPAKVFVDDGEAMLITPAPFAAELEARL